MSERLLNVKSSASSTSIKCLGLERVSEGGNAKKTLLQGLHAALLSNKLSKLPKSLTLRIIKQS